jgi:hypothetical protein
MGTLGFTPLILAAYNGQLAIMEALIARGADACRTDRDQADAAQMGVASKGEDAIAARLFKAGCDVNARNHAGADRANDGFPVQSHRAVRDAAQGRR